MGGRGSVSMKGRLVSSGRFHNVGGAVDQREDIQKSFVDELGFKDVLGTNDINTATLNSYAIALKRLEQKYGAIGMSENPIFVTANGNPNYVAAVARSRLNPADQYMIINSNVLGTTRENLREQAASEAARWSARTDKRITSRNAYTVTHEYAHMYHNALAAKRGVSVEQLTAKARRAIIRTANSKYKRAGYQSTYSKTNPMEFFAEAFANWESGRPDAYGKAMGDWLKKNKLR